MYESAVGNNSNIVKNLHLNIFFFSTFQISFLGIFLKISKPSFLVEQCILLLTASINLKKKVIALLNLITLKLIYSVVTS